MKVIYDAFYLPEILQINAPWYVTLINAIVLPFWLYGLYAFSYRIKIFKILQSFFFWVILTVFIALGSLLSFYFDFKLGEYTNHEMFMISMFSFAFFIPSAYALLHISPPIKRN